MSGSCSASWASAARSEPASSGRSGKTTASSAGRGKRAVASSPGGGSPIASPTRTAPSPRTDRHLAGGERVTPRSPGRREDLDRCRLGVLAAAHPDALARPQRAGVEAHVGDALARRGALDLEHPARDVGLRVALQPGEELVDAGEERVHADAHRRRAEEHRMDPAPPRLVAERRPQPRIRKAGCPVHVIAEDRLVVLGEDLGQPGAMGLVAGRERHDGGAPSARSRGRRPSG